jgi:predicted protein tyrosine phosphatase
VKYKVVTVCQGAHVRSVALKYLLTYKYGHEVLACGWESNTAETRNMLFEWADIIVIMQKEFEKYVPEQYHNKGDERKLYSYDVGEDRYGNPFHPELQEGLIQMIEKHGLFVR